MANIVPKVIADLELQLATTLAIGGTSFTLSASTDDDSVSIPAGLYCFTLDNGTSNKEYLIGQVNGTAVTGVKSVSRQGAETTGAVRKHRIGAPCILTDFATIQRVQAILTGDSPLDGASPILYDAEPTLADRKELATVGYVLDTVVGGTVAFDSMTAAGNAGESIVAGNLVYFKTSDQEWYKTDADTAATVEGVQLGFALGTGSDGVAITGGIQTMGTYTTTGLTAGALYYAGNTAGDISSSAGTTSQVIGIALSTTKLLIIPRNAQDIKDSQKAALAGGGAFGTPSSTNKFATDDYFDDTANFIRNDIPITYLPTPVSTQDLYLTLEDITATEFAMGADSTGSQVYVMLQSVASNFYRFERDALSGTYFRTHTVTSQTTIPTGDEGAIIVIGSYVYLFGNDGTNIICKRYDAATLANETVMTVPTVACVSAVTAWTDGTNAYVVSSNSATTSRTWSLSGTTFTAVTTTTITDPTDRESASFWDGTNAYVIRSDGETDVTVGIIKMNTITGSSQTVTTSKPLPSLSDGRFIAGGFGVENGLMYLSVFFRIYDETGAINTVMRIFPITKP